MEQAIIALSVMVGILTLGLGLTIGYLIRCYVQETTPQYSHPEMFDANGNPLPDELPAIRFEGDLNDNDGHKIVTKMNNNDLTIVVLRIKMSCPVIVRV